MGKLTGNWITGAHSGRACKHDDIYTRVNRKTGTCVSVKLCNPNTDWTQKQEKSRSSFGAVSKAINEWIKANKETSGTKHADYTKVKKVYDRQTKYATLRGMMMAKGMYSINAQGKVTVDIDARGGMSAAPAQGDGGSSSGGDSQGGGGSTPTPGGGDDGNLI